MPVGGNLQVAQPVGADHGIAVEQDDVIVGSQFAALVDRSRIAQVRRIADHRDARQACESIEQLSDSRIGARVVDDQRSEEHTSELQSLMRISYAVFCLKKKTKTHKTITS